MESGEPPSGIPPPATCPGKATEHTLRERFAGLVARHEEGVFGFVYRRVGNTETAQDLAQETFLRAWKAYSDFDPSKDERTWVLTIARNLIASHFRRVKAQKRGHSISLDQLRDTAGDSNTWAEPVDHRYVDPIDRLQKGEAIEAMDGAAKQLKEPERELYILRRQGQSPAEIAQATGRTKAAVDSMLTRIHNKLRSKLSPPGHGPDRA
jgi:RNA polymerase sigma-70 factor, ECF subfamily